MTSINSIASALIIALSAGIYLYSVWQRRSRKRLVGQLSSLTIYPIKSGPGLEFQQAVCTEAGLRSGNLLDRQFVVVSGDTFISSTSNINMTKLALHYDSANDCLILSAEGMEKITLPLTLPTGLNENDVKTFRWYDDTLINYVDCGDVFANWFTEMLDQGCRLARYHPELSDRRINPRETTRISSQRHSRTRVLYGSSHPYLICTQASLDDLNSKLAEPVEVDAFRPNLVVKTDEGVEAYDEDAWREVCIREDIVMYNEHSCNRCARIYVDNKNHCMRKSKEPMTTLMKHRRGEGRFKYHTIFGVKTTLSRVGHMSTDDNSRQVSVGDHVFVSYE